MIQRARTKHLVVLGDVLRGRRAVVESRRKADTLDGALHHAVDFGRRHDANEFEQRWEYVDGVHVLMARFASGGNALWPTEDERIGDATFVGLALPTLERRVARPCPTPRVMVVRVGGAEVVDTAQVLFEAFWLKVEEVHLVERTIGPTL